MTDWDGAKYAEVSALQRTMAELSLAGLEFGPSERVLDVGCGDGFVTALIAAQLPGGGIVGADVSQRMLEQAARTVGDRALFVRADATALPFRAVFDRAVTFNALHWVPDQRKALGAIASTLRPGGRVVIQVVGAGERPSIEAVAMAVTREDRWRPYFADFAAPFVHASPDEFRAGAVAAGFDVVSLITADREWDFGTREKFSAWCGVGVGAWTDLLPAAEVSAFVDDMVARYETVVGRPGLFRFVQLRAELSRQR